MKKAVRGRLCLGDDLTLDEHVLGQTRDLDAASGRERLGEIPGVDGVDGGEIVHILDEHRRLDGLGHVAAGGLQHGGQVAENLMGLRLDALGDGAGGGVDADLAGREHKAAGDLRLRVGAERSGALVVATVFMIMTSYQSIFT